MDALNRAQPSSLANAIETLDGKRHALGVSALMSALLCHLPATSGGLPPLLAHWDTLYNRLVAFIDEADAGQIRLAPAPMSELCHSFTDELVSHTFFSTTMPASVLTLRFLPQIRRGQPILGIPVVSRLLVKLSTKRDVLTSAHSDLCKLCLAAKCFTPVLKMLEEVDFVDLSRDAANTDPKYVLLYFYYGGMILAAVKVITDFIYQVFFQN